MMQGGLTFHVVWSKSTCQGLDPAEDDLSRLAMRRGGSGTRPSGRAAAFIARVGIRGGTASKRDNSRADTWRTRMKAKRVWRRWETWAIRHHGLM